MSTSATVVLEELVVLQEANVKEAIAKKPETESKFRQRFEEYRTLAKWIGESVKPDIVLNESQKNIVSLAMTDLLLHSAETGPGTKVNKLMDLIRFINHLR